MQEAPASGLLNQPSALAEQQTEMARALHNLYTRGLSLALTAYLRMDVTTEPAGLERLPYEEFARTLASSGYACAFGLPAAASSGVLTLDPSLVLPVLDVLLGAPASAGVLDRPLTEIEQTLLEGLAKLLLAGLEESWGEIAEPDLHLRVFSNAAEAARALPAEEAVIAAGVRMDLAGVEGTFRLAIPAAILTGDQPQPLEQTHVSIEQEKRILALLKPGLMDLEVHLDGSGMRMKDLAGLKPGRILRLDHSVERPLTCLVNGTTELSGQVVRSGKQRAFIVGDPTEAA